MSPEEQDKGQDSDSGTSQSSQQQGEQRESEVQNLNLLTVKRNPNSINAVTPPEEWTELEVTVDSGACDTVMPMELCKGIPVMDSPGSKEGLEYEVANGAGLPNLGERRCLLMTVGSQKAKRIVFQVADVHKPLLSISRCADMGFMCVLGNLGGYLRDEVTGERIPLQRRDNLYILRTWVRADPSQGNDASSFRRPA